MLLVKSFEGLGLDKKRDIFTAGSREGGNERKERKERKGRKGKKVGKLAGWGMRPGGHMDEKSVF